MEGTIDRLARAMSSGAVFIVTSGIAFVLFAVLWLGFAWGALVGTERLEDAWQWLRDLPLVLEGLLWLLLLPVTAGLAIWQSDWPGLLRLLLVVALAAWSLLIFLPRRSTPT